MVFIVAVVAMIVVVPGGKSASAIKLIKGTKILTGTNSVDWNSSDWSLDDDLTGDRTAKRYIPFSESFVSPPTVTVGLTNLDVDHERNTRVEVYPTDVTSEGFNVTYRTWWDSRIWGLGVSWIAIGK